MEKAPVGRRAAQEAPRLEQFLARSSRIHRGPSMNSMSPYVEFEFTPVPEVDLNVPRLGEKKNLRPKIFGGLVVPALRIDFMRQKHHFLRLVARTVKE